jgi:hypothetical protein
MLCEAIREDVEAVSASVAVLGHAINAGIVLRGQPLASRPFPRGPAGGPRDKSTEAATTWRGGGFADTARTRAFFVPGKQYRAPQFVATSFERSVARRFMRAAVLSGGEAASGVGVANSRVLWKVRLDSDQGCEHVTLLTNSHVQREHEFLFTAFSVFTVELVHWSADPTEVGTPHEITVRAAVDNTQEPEDLPLAPWC